ncbi:MAG TPA: cytidine deaminase [Actinomycetota bacterium]|nr:cytidine deaminase [Actinomycetota bacterium]
MSTAGTDLEGSAGAVLVRSGREDLGPLVAEALAAARQAYAPYSRFQVGAVVVTDAGRHFAGCNVENVSYPLGTCAERDALAAYVLGRDTGEQIETLTLVAIQDGPEGPKPVACSPCGACRQAILELGPGSEVSFLWGSPLTVVTARAPELLPKAFDFEATPDAGPASTPGMPE